MKKLVRVLKLIRLAVEAMGRREANLLKGEGILFLLLTTLKNDDT
jgi:hypothetical protein